jgi:hypothetical protein
MTGVGIRRAVLVGGLAALAGGALAVGVTAHTGHIPSEITINAGSDYFYGAVSSPKASCEKGRRVRVFRRKPGRDKLFGAERSLGGQLNLGQYTVTESDVNFRGGAYYSKIRKHDLKPSSGSHDHICRGASSNTTTVTETMR